MLRSYKTEINPTQEQIVKIHKTIGTCRFIYNFYIAKNIELYKHYSSDDDSGGNSGKKFMTAREFSVWLNNEYLPNHPTENWIKEVSSKSIKKSIEDGYTAMVKFFKKKSDFPKFKKKGKVNDSKMYFVKNSPTDCLCERHRIKIPTLGWVRLKEKGYIPTASENVCIKSGTISMKAGRYYVSVTVDVELPDTHTTCSTNIIDNNSNSKIGMGIDLGLKDFAIMNNSDGKVYKKKNINKTARVKKLEKKLRREQRCLSRKFENLKKNKSLNKKEKGEVTQNQEGKNIQKQKLKVQKIHQRLDNIRTDYINKTISEIVKTKPSYNYITIEDLNVSGMMKNKHLSKAIASQKFYEFTNKLKYKCDSNGIELRIVDRFYPSSKLCHNCGSIKKDLKLSDRTYKCNNCGYTCDRDINASLNLRDTKVYKIA